MRLHEILRAGADRWHSTDWLVIGAGFDLDLDVAEWDDVQVGSTRGLPVNFFLDSGKSGRKYVLGALKALYWLELVAWRNHTRQAIEWRWVAPVDEVVRIPPMPAKPGPLDPYLHDDPGPIRADRVRQRGAQRVERYELQRLAWIDTNHPYKAARFRQEQERRLRERRARTQATAPDDDDVDPDEDDIAEEWDENHDC